MHLASYAFGAACCGIGACVYVLWMQWMHERRLEKERGARAFWRMMAKDRQEGRKPA